jgi:hypothetical protein
MILLIGMLLFKEEDMQKKKREEHLSVLYTPLLRKTESEEISRCTADFSLLLGEGVVQFNRKRQHLV